MAKRKLSIRAITNLDSMGMALAFATGHAEGEVGARHKWTWEDKPYGVANEYICGELGHFLGLPLPPFAIAESMHFRGPIFSTINVNYDGRDFSPVEPDACCACLPEICAGAIVFDVLIANSDRHPRNLVVDNDAKPSEIYLYDHDVAFFGCFKGDGISRLKDMAGRLAITGKPPAGGNRHVFLNKLKSQDYLGVWCDRICTIPTSFIERVCKRALGFGITTDEYNAGIRFLCDRRGSMRSILNRHHEEFKGIKSWKLL